jgi:NADH dehydrogenase FAD-containing subunit
MATGTIAILGTGTGGLVAAHRLRRRLDAGRIVLVDRDPTYQFAPSFLWVMSGARRPKQITRDRSRHGHGSDPTSRAREILAERYARGEIDTDEYHDRLQHLQ